jgi:hypothetical protein
MKSAIEIVGLPDVVPTAADVPHDRLGVGVDVIVEFHSHRRSCEPPLAHL